MQINLLPYLVETLFQLIMLLHARCSIVVPDNNVTFCILELILYLCNANIRTLNLKL
jgi:hypothetical protein